MSDETTTSHAEIAGVVIDLAQVPSHDGPAGSHVRSTGTGYVLDDGTVVARAEIVAGPRTEAGDE